MRLLLPILAALLLLPIQAKADETNGNILDLLSKVNAKEGFIYSINQRRGMNFVATPIFDKWNLSLDLGLVSTDGLGLALDYNLGALPVEDVPILQYAKFINIGVGGYWRTITSATTDSDPKADNKLGWGPTIFAKWNF